MISTGLPVARDPWHDGAMPKRSSPKRDFMEVGRAIVEQAIGEQIEKRDVIVRREPVMVEPF